MTEDEDRSLEQLEEWVEEIRDLLAFIGPTTEIAYHADDPGSRAWSKEARTRLEKVKQDLHGEAERLSLLEQKRGLSRAEASYLVRTIQRVSAYLTLKASETNGEQWRRQLGSAVAHFELPISRLKSKHDAATKKVTGSNEDEP